MRLVRQCSPSCFPLIFTRGSALASSKSRLRCALRGIRRSPPVAGRLRSAMPNSLCSAASFGWSFTAATNSCASAGRQPAPVRSRGCSGAREIRIEADGVRALNVMRPSRRAQAGFVLARADHGLISAPQKLRDRFVHAPVSCQRAAEVVVRLASRGWSTQRFVAARSLVDRQATAARRRAPIRSG